MANGARLKRIAAWHLSVKHPKSRRTQRTGSLGDNTTCRFARFTHCYVERTWGVKWEVRKQERKKERRGWMDGWMEERRM